MKANLVLHCGARAISRENLSRIQTPARTETWCPIPHIMMVEQVERCLAQTGMKVVNESYGVTDNGARMFGLLQVARQTETNENAEAAYVIGLRGATDKTLSRGLAVGHQMFVCDNLSFSSEIVMHRKQTKNILDDLPLMVETAIGELHKRWDNQTNRIDAYKRKEIGLRDADHLLAGMAGDVFPWQKFEDIRKEFVTPRHAEFGKENVWTLFNAVTEYLKPRAESKASGLWTMPARTSRLHLVCDQFTGLTVAGADMDAVSN